MKVRRPRRTERRKMGRPDGIRVKDQVPIYYLIPQFMTERHDSMNMCTVDIPVEPLRQYMNAKRREGKHISHMALILAAYVQVVAEFPCLNRFVINKRIYQHKDLKVSLVVLRNGGSANDDTNGKLDLDVKDTVFDIQRKIDEYIEINTAGAEEIETGIDKAMAVILKMSFLLNFIGWVLRFGDKHGLLPQALLNVSPFHASVLLTNLASIRTNHVYHHVYDFGTTSVSIAMGNMRDTVRRGPGGKVEVIRCLPLGVVMDERIASGHYFALVFAKLKDLLAHPEELEKPAAPEKVIY